MKLLTYCILDNHFHLLVEVPGEVGELSDAELIRRAGYLYGGKARPGQPLTLSMVEGALALGGGDAGVYAELVDAPDGESADVCEGAEAAVFDWIQSAE